MKKHTNIPIKKTPFKLCLNCMEEKPNAYGRCPHCGFDNANYVSRKNQLPPYTVLNRKYVIGRVIDAGGFGIVYLAKDFYSNSTIAIKEFFPASMMTRDTGTYNGEISTTYLASPKDIDEMRQKFLREARVLARFQDLEGIVHIKDLFEENGTAYMAMEYLDGIELKDYLQRNGTLTFQETITLLRPVMNALKTLHGEGIVHRDISPDNIMLLKNGGVKLLDFGGAKNTLHQSDKRSEMVMIKKGYTPIEQYSTNSNIGPWTDIYALCATIYRCIVGETLPEPMELSTKKIIPPSQMGVKIPLRAEKTLLKGLEINYSNRIKNIRELIDVFYRDASKTGEKTSKQKYIIIAGAVALVLLIAGVTIRTGIVRRLIDKTEYHSDENDSTDTDIAEKSDSDDTGVDNADVADTDVADADGLNTEDQDSSDRKEEKTYPAPEISTSVRQAGIYNVGNILMAQNYGEYQGPKETFSFKYPRVMYETVDCVFENDGQDIDISFSCSKDPSALLVSIHPRSDNMSLEERKAAILEVAKNELSDLEILSENQITQQAVSDSQSETAQVIYLKGRSSSAVSYRVYRIETETIETMILDIPEAIDEEDRAYKDYFAERMYCSCGFGGNTEPPTWQTFKKNYDI